MANDILLGSELGQEFDLGVEVAGKVSVKVDGQTITKSADGTLSAVTVMPEFDSANGIIHFPSALGGTGSNIDLSQFLTDIQVTGGSFDAATSVLTLVDNDNDDTDDIVLDLSTQLGVSDNANNLLTNGDDSKPFLSKSVVSGEIAAYNTANGVAHTSLFGTQLFTTIA